VIGFGWRLKVCTAKISIHHNTGSEPDLDFLELDEALKNADISVEKRRRSHGVKRQTQILL
jgi:hypothetical protein